MTAQTLRTKLDYLKGAKAQLERQYQEARKAHILAYREAAASEEAKVFLKMAAAKTQEQIKYHITGLGTMALQAVFGEDIALDLQFSNPVEDEKINKRSNTTAKLLFLRGNNKQPVNPLDADSGGACDVASEALQVSLWTMQKPRTRNLMVRDERLKNINDPSREMHERAAEMIQQISHNPKIQMQYIIVTMLPELEDIADKVFKL